MELIRSSEMKNAFVRLFNIYANELSKYNPWLGTQIDSQGNYLSKHVEKLISDRSLDAFCITYDKKAVGFVVFSYSDRSGGNICSIDEIFLIETSRGLGISERICTEFWRKYKGICTLSVLKANLSAVAYWEKLISRCGYTYEKHEKNEQMWRYEIDLESYL
ncbi:MAG: family N-acetyltransferase [Bacillales bacterium]|jgi:predicted acetyltransferase|nr:family N-acetyltransferase [Bacillales bacterium]